MRVDCAGCAGCCIDWRAIAPFVLDHERRGPRQPLDDVYNLVPLTRDDARALLNAGLADATTPRFWRVDHGGVVFDGIEIAAIDGKPAFFLGLRKPVKPVAPFGRATPAWLPTCAFLDPTTLQCRIHDSDLYPQECAEYPGHNLVLGAKTECERVEAAFGDDRLLDGEPPGDLSGLLLGPWAVGQKIFLHPEPDRLEGVIRRAVEGRLGDDDRAEFVAAAVSMSPGSVAHNPERFADAYERAREADSWVGRACREWTDRSGPVGSDAPSPRVAKSVEDDRGAPPTPGWE